MHIMKPLAAEGKRQSLMYRCCFGEEATRRSSSFGSLRVLMDQDKPGSWIDSAIKGPLVSHLPAEDPTVLIVHVEADGDSEGNPRRTTSVVEEPLCFHPIQPNSRFDTGSGNVKLKIHASECKTLANGRQYYSALSLRRRLAQARRLATGTVDSRPYQVVSSRSDRIIALPHATENILEAFGSRIRLKSSYDATDRSSYRPRIKGRHFEFDGILTCAGRTLNFVEHANRHNQGTSYNVWDGALLLARYLEHAAEIVKGLRVLELGAGCGVAGLSAAALGASYVTMTDLPGDILEHLQRNIDANEELLVECTVEARSCDWRDPPRDLVAVRKYDLVLIADCIWVEELVAPLFDVLEMLTRSIDDAPLVEETTASTTVLPQKHNKDETFVPIQEVGKHTRDEKSSGTLDDSTHEMFERGPLKRHDAVGQSSFFTTDDLDDYASFYEEGINTTKVLISYQRRGKSTHETFMNHLHSLFSTVEIVQIPNQPDLLTIFSCQR